MTIRRLWVAAVALLPACVLTLPALELGGADVNADGGTAGSSCFGETTRGEALSDATVIHASGRALHQNGSAVDRVLVVQNATLTDFVFNLATGFLYCLLDSPTGDCRHTQRLTPDAEGAFAFTATGAEARQVILGLALYTGYQLLTQGPADAGQLAGPWAQLHFTLTRSEVTLPVLTLWEPEVQRTTVADGIWLGSHVLPEFACVSHDPPTLVLETANGDIWWSQPAQDGVANQVVEDWNGGASVVGRYFYTANNAEVLRLGSARLPIYGTAGAPPSRGAACTVDGSGGTTYAAGTCPATDGSTAGLDVRSPSSMLTVDLGAAHTITRVVVRGTFRNALVEASADNNTWTPVGTLGTNYASVTLGGTVGRWVRIRRAEAGNLDRVMELSVW